MTRGGFTLIEVLAAVAVAALIVSAAYGVASSTITAQKRTEEVIDVRKEGAAILDLVCEDLAAAVFKKDAEVFIFDADQTPSPFHFMSVAWDPETGRQTLGETGYLFEQAGDAIALFRRFGILDGSISEGGTELLISDEIESWKTECFDGKEWNEVWENAKSLPTAVRVTFALVSPRGELVRFRREVAIRTSDLIDPFALPSEEETIE